MIFDLELKRTSSKALIDDSGEYLTYGDLATQIVQCKSYLPSRSIVFILGENTNSVVSFIISCLENQWVPLVLAKDLDEGLLENYIITYQPNAIFCREKLNLTTFPFEKVIPWNDYSLQVLHHEKHQLYEKLGFLLPTSGSTGSPKLVRHSYENLSFSAKSVSNFFRLSTSDVGLAVLPVYYTMGFSVISSHLQAGATVYLTNFSITDKGFWEIFKNAGITILTGVPYTFEILFKMRFERINIPSLRIVSQGGGKLSETIWDSLVSYAKKNKLEFIPTYGQTEGTARMSFLESSFVESKKGSIGKAIPGCEFEIWDSNDQVINETVAEGELIFKGKNVTLGYAENLLDLMKGDERNGVLSTGDIVRRDDEGFIYIIGRKKRFVKVYGLRISLDEIEQLIRNQFNIDCFAAGTDTQIKVYINKEGIETTVKDWLSNKIKLFHQAIEVNFISEIPRNSSGKVIFVQ